MMSLRRVSNARVPFQDEVRNKEQEIKTLREDIKCLDCLKEMSAQEIKEIKATLGEKKIHG